MGRYAYDAVVVGAGPNGLAAAIVLAQAGCSVCVLEANEQPGGAVRSAALTRPGFVHDIGSAIHPLGVASPFFCSLPLDAYGLRWIHPDLPLAHPLDDGTAAVLHRSLAATTEELGERDGPVYEALLAPLVEAWSALLDDILRPVLRIPRHPLLLARFGMRALAPTPLLGRLFRTEAARALLAGLAAHSTLPLESPGASAFGLVLGVAGHAVGWPFPAGGAQQITHALVAYLQALGGELQTGRRVERLSTVPPSRVVLLDVTPRQFLRLAGERLPAGYRRRLMRYRYGPGVFKIDYALDEPIPWTAAACRRAGTVHLGGTLHEIAASERDAFEGRVSNRPYVLLAQHSLFDGARAPEGQHTVWAYCHVPHGASVDMTGAIERQIERFAPGFRDCILARHTMGPADLERRDANLVGGDINGGVQDLVQLLARPVLHPTPYRTPLPGVYLCSSSTPPGGGVHGMCGYHAAQTALRDWLYGKDR